MDATALLALGGTLGGAAIGVGATLLVQYRRERSQRFERAEDLKRAQAKRRDTKAQEEEQERTDASRSLRGFCLAVRLTTRRWQDTGEEIFDALINGRAMSADQETWLYSARRTEPDQYAIDYDYPWKMDRLFGDVRFPNGVVPMLGPILEPIRDTCAAVDKFAEAMARRA